MFTEIIAHQSLECFMLFHSLFLLDVTAFVCVDSRLEILFTSMRIAPVKLLQWTGRDTMCCHLAVRHTALHQHAVRERQRFLPLSRRLSRRILSDSIKTEAVMLFRGGSTLVSDFVRQLKRMLCSYEGGGSRGLTDAKKFFAGFHCGGHRGSPRVAPENTIESFEKARQSNVDLIEFDLSLTKDAVAIIMHDDDLERTCAEKTPVSALLAHEIVTKNAAKNFKFADGKQKICPVPTLEQTVKYGRDSNLKMLFDVKDGSKEMISQIVNVISKNNLYDQVIVSSFFAWVPYAVKKADPKILTGVTWRPYFFSYSDIENKHPRFTGLKHYLAVLLDWINVKMIHSFLPQFVGAEMVLTQERDINGCFVDDMQKKNIQVVAWTVNDQRQMMHFVDTLKVPILTDVPHKFSRLSSLRSELNALSKEPDTFDNSDSSKYKAIK